MGFDSAEMTALADKPCYHRGRLGGTGHWNCLLSQGELTPKKELLQWQWFKSLQALQNEVFAFLS